MVRKDAEFDNIWLKRLMIIYLFSEFKNLELVTDDKFYYFIKKIF